MKSGILQRRLRGLGGALHWNDVEQSTLARLLLRMWFSCCKQMTR
jgi:hypothetical protein